MARLVVARPSVSASATVAANTGRCTRPVARCITTSAARFAISVPLSPAEQLEVVEKTTNVVKKFNRVDPEKVSLSSASLHGISRERIEISIYF